MRRREFIAGFVAWPVVALAQESGGMRRIGVISYEPENDVHFLVNSPRGCDQAAKARGSTDGIARRSTKITPWLNGLHPSQQGQMAETRAVDRHS
jgi:hypothetical protein